MIAVFLVLLLVMVIVVSYIALVNRMLRSDENWSESNMGGLAARAQPAVPTFEVDSHAHA